MVQSKYKIYVDMDGVLTDWEKQFERLFGVPVETYESEHGKEKRYELVHKNSPNFYATMPWMNDGKILYNFIKEFPTEILSHATDAECKQGKEKWLSDHNVTLKQNLVPEREDKAKFATPDSILIDDREDNVNEFIQAGGIGILHKNATDTINKLKETLGVKESYRVYNSILNPEIWDGETLKPEVLSQLLKIATTFYKDTELTAPIEDIYFLGSTAGYNWTPTSDIDLHVLIDFSKVDENKELVKKLVDGYKNKWNEQHDISVDNHPVEVYIQDINDVNRSQAVYSILHNKWIKKPSYEDVKIDKDAIKTKYKDLVTKINKAVEQQDLDTLKDLVQRIYKMREAGLSSGGEYSTENLVFKLLRASGFISKLRINITNLVDKDLNKL
jgi:predicted nucleotidyltransferase